MQFSDRFKNFIKYNKHLINSRSWDELYDEFKYSGIIESKSTLTNLLKSIGVDPELTLHNIPHEYLSGNFTIKELDLSQNNALWSIDQFAFYYCVNLNIVKFPEGLNSIGMYSFGNCTNLKNLYLPSTLEEIKMYAFCCCTKLKDIEFAGTIKQWRNIKKEDSNRIFFKVPCRKIKCSDGYAKLRNQFCI